ncbi:hypothetical protein GCM10010439_26830 [Actinocorallia aurantiaca]|uniref:6-phosphogluconate dehydrogenase NADP-binding domain-containing protein n=1 Tax=Actinocorallia aurantiaca TaxID=46204 RepID=A0ABP6GQD4_9ACTN
MPTVVDVIAFMGLGRMGVPMAERLVAAGHEVTVWNRTARDVAGAVTAAGPAEAVAGAGIVVTMLRDGAAVEETLTAALPGLEPGTVVVEMSTIGPEAVGGLRGLLPKGVGLVDAPVLGSVEPARTGRLTVLAAGFEQDLTRVRPVLETFGTVREVGAPGAGAALKTAVMSAVVPGTVLLAETLELGRSLGVERELLLEVLEGTPMGAFARRAATAPCETGYALGLAAKDLALARPAAGTLAAAAHARLRDEVAAGRGDSDLRALSAGPVRASRVETINPPTVPATNGFYSHATRAGDLLFVSGQVALDDGGELVGPDDMTAQSERVMVLLGRVLADQGCAFEDVTHIRTFTTDLSRLREYGAVRSRYFLKDPPASTTVEVSRLFVPGALLEVELTASVR